MSGKSKDETPAKRFYRRRVALFALIGKIKLWPSRQGVLHGIKTIDVTGDQARITTHCDRVFMAANSKNSRAARWLRNKWHRGVCTACGVPEWKLVKYSATFFENEYGTDLG